MQVTVGNILAEHWPRVDDLMREQLGFEQALEILGMSWEQFQYRMRTTGSMQVITCDGQFAGCVWTEYRGEVLHLHGLLLVPEFQGKGIGTVVMNSLPATNCSVIELGVSLDNPRAIRLYERLGFHTVKQLADIGYLIMQKPVS